MSRKTTNRKIAVIDVGSNSVRLMNLCGEKKEKVNVITRLAEGTTFSGKLSSEAISRTVDAVKNFYARSIANGVDEIYIYATAAVRNNEGGNLFCEEVYKSIGVEVDVLSGEEEAKAGAYGALFDGERIIDGGIIDIGGGSSEICVYNCGKEAYAHSLNLGAVKLFDEFKKDREKIDERCCEKVKEYGRVLGGEFYAVGGTATSIASILLKLKVYDQTKTHGFRIEKDKLYDLLEELYSTDAEDLSKKYAVQLKRAEIIAGGANLLYRIMEMLGVKHVIVSENDNLEGYLILRGI